MVWMIRSQLNARSKYRIRIESIRVQSVSSVRVLSLYGFLACARNDLFSFVILNGAKRSEESTFAMTNNIMDSSLRSE